MIKSNMDLVFFGSATYSIPALVVLLKHDYRIIVVTIPDKPAGRGLKLKPNPLAAFAQEKRLTVPKPNKLDQDTLKDLQKVDKSIELGICCVYGKIIPQSWLEYFPKGIINIHPSLLPKYRGSSPAQSALLNNDQETGISFIKMDKLCDHGPLLYQEKDKILLQDTSESLYKRLFDKAANKLPSVIENYLSGKLKPTPQKHSQASFTKMLQKKDGYIPLKDLKNALISKDQAKIIDLKRRAFTPWPGIYTQVKVKSQEKRLKILKTSLKRGKLMIEQVQLEGKSPVTFLQFSSSYPHSF